MRSGDGANVSAQSGETATVTLGVIVRSVRGNHVIKLPVPNCLFQTEYIPTLAVLLL